MTGCSRVSSLFALLSTKWLSGTRRSTNKADSSHIVSSLAIGQNYSYRDSPGARLDDVSEVQFDYGLCELRAGVELPRAGTVCWNTAVRDSQFPCQSKGREG